jgi:hypothetical protein
MSRQAHDMQRGPLRCGLESDAAHTRAGIQEAPGECGCERRALGCKGRQAPYNDARGLALSLQHRRIAGLPDGRALRTLQQVPRLLQRVRDGGQGRGDLRLIKVTEAAGHYGGNHIVQPARDVGMNLQRLLPQA